MCCNRESTYYYNAVVVTACSVTLETVSEWVVQVIAEFIRFYPDGISNFVLNLLFFLEKLMGLPACSE